jgi:hypothetical protein
MRRSHAAAAVLLVVGATPASATSVSLDAACQATREALAAGGTIAPGDVVVAGPRIVVGGRILEPSGTYGLLTSEGLRERDRKAALGYLRAPRATAWFAVGRFPDATGGWTSDYEQARAVAVPLPADCGASAGSLLSRSGATYQYARATVVLDEAGRISQWSGAGLNLSFTYGPQRVDLPTRWVAFARWQRASQAASLNATMRTIARAVAAATEPRPVAIAEAMEAAIDPDRAVPLRTRALRQGTLMFARNPYTRTYHAWRVYVRDGEVRARRVAP